MPHTSSVGYLSPSNESTEPGECGSADASAIDSVASAADEAGAICLATSSQVLSPVAIPAVTERPKFSSESIRLDTFAAPPRRISDSTTSALPIGVHALSLQPVAATTE